MKFSSLKVLIASSVLATITSTVSAGQATGTMSVTATVTPKCTITTIDAMAFGNYIQENGDMDSSGNITFSCPVGTAYDVGIDGIAGGFRTINNGASTLQYNLFTNAGRTTAWGLIGGAGVTGTMGAGGTATLPVYGRVFDNAANRALPAGAYSGTVTVTIAY